MSRWATPWTSPITSPPPAWSPTRWTTRPGTTEPPPGDHVSRTVEVRGCRCSPSLTIPTGLPVHRGMPCIPGGGAVIQPSVDGSHPGAAQPYGQGSEVLTMARMQRLAGVLACTVVAGLGCGQAAMAATTANPTVTGTVSAGALSVATSAAPTFSANLANGDSTPTYTLPLTAVDTTGTGAGWNLTITSTQFTTGGATPHTLAANASTITGVTAACASGTCTNPTNAVTYPVSVPAA